MGGDFLYLTFNQTYSKNFTPGPWSWWGDSLVSTTTRELVLQLDRDNPMIKTGDRLLIADSPMFYHQRVESLRHWLRGEDENLCKILIYGGWPEVSDKVLETLK